MKLRNVDKTDMQVWATSHASEEFFAEIRDRRDQANRTVLKKLDPRDAGMHDAFDQVLALYEEFLSL